MRVNLVCNRDDLCIYSFDEEILNKAMNIFSNYNEVPIEVMCCGNQRMFFSSNSIVDMGYWINKVTGKEVVPVIMSKKIKYIYTIYDDISKIYMTFMVNRLVEPPFLNIREKAVKNYLKNLSLTVLLIRYENKNS